MFTGQRQDFEKSLIKVLKSESVPKSIFDGIINTIPIEFNEKFNLFDDKLTSLKAVIEILKSNNNKFNDDISEHSYNNLEQKVDYLEQWSNDK